MTNSNDLENIPAHLRPEDPAIVEDDFVDDDAFPDNQEHPVGFVPA